MTRMPRRDTPTRGGGSVSAPSRRGLLLNAGGEIRRSGRERARDAEADVPAAGGSVVQVASGRAEDSPTADPGTPATDGATTIAARPGRTVGIESVAKDSADSVHRHLGAARDRAGLQREPARRLVQRKCRPRAPLEQFGDERGDRRIEVMIFLPSGPAVAETSVRVHYVKRSRRTKPGRQHLRLQTLMTSTRDSTLGTQQDDVRCSFFVEAKR